MKPKKIELFFESVLKGGPTEPTVFSLFEEAKLEALKICENVADLARFNVMIYISNMDVEARINLHNDVVETLKTIDFVNTRDQYSKPDECYALLDAMYLCKISPKMEGVLNLIFLDDFKKPGGSDA